MPIRNVLHSTITSLQSRCILERDAVILGEETRKGWSESKATLRERMTG